jgi:hypothetical protein
MHCMTHQDIRVRFEIERRPRVDSTVHVVTVDKESGIQIACRDAEVANIGGHNEVLEVSHKGEESFVTQ